MVDRKRKALITGASRGIGKAIAEKFREHGYEVVTPTRQEMDLTDGASVDAYISQHKDEYFDVIVNNAGINDIHEIGVLFEAFNRVVAASADADESHVELAVCVFYLRCLA